MCEAALHTLPRLLPCSLGGPNLVIYFALDGKPQAPKGNQDIDSGALQERFGGGNQAARGQLLRKNYVDDFLPELRGTHPRELTNFFKEGPKL
jgi:hypothetical protein